MILGSSSLLSMSDTHEHDGSNGRNGFARRLLGTLGLLWVGTLVLRALRGYEGRSIEAGVMDGPRPRRFTPKPFRGYEKRDASVKWILALVLGFLVCGVIIHLILGGYLNALKHQPPPADGWQPIHAAARASPVRASFPQLQISPPLDLQAFRAREQEELNSYGWINRTSGVARIPVEQAMEALLQEGLPTRATTNQTGASSYQLIQRRLEHREPEIHR
jgi:hypothetical protein